MPDKKPDVPTKEPKSSGGKSRQEAGLPPVPAAQQEEIERKGSQSGGATEGSRELDRPATSTQEKLAPGEAISVVGIGASAGGVQVLQEFFGEMKADSGLAFVVVMHLSPEHQSNLAQILQSKTRMPVTQVTGRTSVKRDNVYVIPPNKHLLMTNHSIELIEPQHAEGRRVVIDLFFRTLAEQYGQRAVCIVMSGTDSDGVIGLKHIKAQGGVTIAQEPSEAEHDSMPRSAIDTGMVDWILPVREMPARLLKFVHNEKEMTLPPEEEAGAASIELPDVAPQGPGGPLVARKTTDEEDESALQSVLLFLRSQTGHDFAHYKRATVLRRIARRLQVNSLEDVPSYLEYIHTHPDEVHALLHDLLIGVTHFFRDQHAFAALAANIPQLFVPKKQNDQVRVWVPGCATGEEAYSIAMLLCEHAQRLEYPPSIQLFATDLDEQSVKIARDGIYPTTIEADVSPERLRRFFYQVHGRYRIKKEIRELVLFAAHDLLRDSPFSKLDLISCRNLLIYLKPEAQHRVLDIFHFALRAGGLLMLGGSETVEDNHALFAPLDKRNRIFVRRATPRGAMMHLGSTLRLRPLLPDTVIPRLATPPAVTETTLAPAADMRELTPTQQRMRSLGELHAHLLEAYAPPSVVVDQNYDILHVSDNAGQYLHFGPGEPSANLLRLVDDTMRLELRTALFRAAEHNEKVDVGRVRFERDGNVRVVKLYVRPAEGVEPGEKFFLVVFDEQAVTEQEQAAPVPQSHEGVARLQEEELRQLRAQLNTTVEQYEASNEELKASNEELQAMNEELRSATEELETSKEELQSINEELTTVNHELKSNVEELSRTNSDLQNLMASTDIGTIFLNRSLHIKRFTPRVQELFNVIATDIGRPLSDITNKLHYPQLSQDAEKVLRSLAKTEREVQAGEQWFLARVVPYRTIEDRIDGVVVNFVDITARRKVEEELKRNMEQLSRFNNVAVGRESRMIELKKEINDLCVKLGQPPRYSLEFEKGNNSPS